MVAAGRTSRVAAAKKMLGDVPRGGVAYADGGEAAGALEGGCLVGTGPGPAEPEEKRAAEGVLSGRARCCDRARELQTRHLLAAAVKVRVEVAASKCVRWPKARCRSGRKIPKTRCWPISTAPLSSSAMTVIFYEPSQIAFSNSININFIFMMAPGIIIKARLASSLNGLGLALAKHGNFRYHSYIYSLRRAYDCHKYLFYSPPSFVFTLIH